MNFSKKNYIYISIVLYKFPLRLPQVSHMEQLQPCDVKYNIVINEDTSTEAQN